MRLDRLEDIYTRVFAMTGRGHEGRIQRLEKAPSSGSIGLRWAYIGSTGHTTIASGATTVLPADQTKFYTNAATVFDVALNGGNYGIRFLTTGHYWIVATASPFGAPSVGAQYELEEASSGGADSGMFGGPMAVLMGSPARTDQGAVRLELLQTVDGSVAVPPTAAFLTQIQNVGASSVAIILDAILVFQLDADATLLS